MSEENNVELYFDLATLFFLTPHQLRLFVIVNYLYRMKEGPPEKLKNIKKVFHPKCGNFEKVSKLSFLCRVDKRKQMTQIPPTYESYGPTFGPSKSHQIYESFHHHGDG
uniref:Uncharacterized protein n=1 Tax=Romanomermis culicivorax TaxID=13658 RepID=A0A915IRV2_ROMCU